MLDKEGHSTGIIEEHCTDKLLGLISIYIHDKCILGKEEVCKKILYLLFLLAEAVFISLMLDIVHGNMLVYLLLSMGIQLHQLCELNTVYHLIAGLGGPH